MALFSLVLFLLSWMSMIAFGNPSTAEFLTIDETEKWIGEFGIYEDQGKIHVTGVLPKECVKNFHFEWKDIKLAPTQMTKTLFVSDQGGGRSCIETSSHKRCDLEPKNCTDIQHHVGSISTKNPRQSFNVGFGYKAADASFNKPQSLDILVLLEHAVFLSAKDKDTVQKAELNKRIDHAKTEFNRLKNCSDCQVDEQQAKTLKDLNDFLKNTHAVENSVSSSEHEENLKNIEKAYFRKLIQSIEQTSPEGLANLKNQILDHLRKYPFLDRTLGMSALLSIADKYKDHQDTQQAFALLKALQVSEAFSQPQKDRAVIKQDAYKLEKLMKLELAENGKYSSEFKERLKDTKLSFQVTKQKVCHDLDSSSCEKAKEHLNKVQSFLKNTEDEKTTKKESKSKGLTQSETVDALRKDGAQRLFADYLSGEGVHPLAKLAAMYQPLMHPYGQGGLGMMAGFGGFAGMNFGAMGTMGPPMLETVYPHPSSMNHYGQPGMMPPYGQPGMMPPYGQPGMMPPYGQPGMMPPYGQPGMMPPYGQPGMMPPYGQPGMMPPYGQPGMMPPMMQNHFPINQGYGFQGGIPQSGMPYFNGMPMGGMPMGGMPMGGMPMGGMPMGGMPMGGMPMGGMPMGGMPMGGMPMGGMPMGGMPMGGMPMGGMPMGGMPMGGMPPY